MACVRVLLDAGADRTLRNRGRQTALEIAEAEESDTFGEDGEVYAEVAALLLRE